MTCGYENNRRKKGKQPPRHQNKKILTPRSEKVPTSSAAKPAPADCGVETDTGVTCKKYVLRAPTAFCKAYGCFFLFKGHACLVCFS